MIDKLPGIDNISSSDVIVVTGGSGLFGSAIKEMVLKFKVPGKWHFLNSKDADLRYYEQTKSLFEKLRPTYVIHLAAFVGGLFRNMSYKVDFWLDNVNMNNNVLKCSHDFHVKKVVSCLSTCVFPDKIEKYPFDESVLHEGPPHFSNDAYAYSKRMLALLGKWYNDQYPNGTKFTSVIPTNLFGPNDNFNVEHGHVLPGLIHKCYISQKEDKDFVVFGTGKPLRQFLYSYDAAEMLLFVLLNHEHGDPILLTVGENDEKSIGEMAEMIKDAFQLKQKMVFDTTKADGQYKKTASNKTFMSLFPQFKYTPLETSIHETVTWFLRNYDLCRK